MKTLIPGLRSAVYYAILAVSTVFFALLAVIIRPLPYRVRYRIIGYWAHFNLWTLNIICGLGYTVTGTENIPAETAIIFAKHQSAWETLALQQIFPPHVWVLKRELLWLPLFGWGLATLEPIAIDRSSGRKAVEQIIEKGRKRLEDGRWVMVFPEGTRVAPGKRGRYGIGGALLAESTGYPVVPVAHNAGEFWSRNAFIKRPGTIQVVIGPVLDTRGMSAAEIRDKTEEWIESTMLTLNLTRPDTSPDTRPDSHSDPAD